MRDVPQECHPACKTRWGRRRASPPAAFAAVLLGVNLLGGGVRALTPNPQNAMQWQPAAGPPERRFFQSLAAVGGKLYMFGDADYDSLLSFDPQVLYCKASPHLYPSVSFHSMGIGADWCRNPT